jgi:heat shock protein HslJ
LTRTLLILAIAALLGCTKQSETVAGIVPEGSVWLLQSINNTSVSARTTLEFGPDQTFSGSAPCNRYGGTLTVPLPWFEAEAIFSTKRACPDLAEEASYFDALNKADRAEVAGDTLLLTGPETELTFRLEN